MLTKIKGVLIVVVLLWVAYILNILIIFIDFNQFGIRPREIEGLVGIVVAPFLHGNFPHLISNSIPLLILGSTSMILYEKSTPGAVIWITLIGGFLVWLSGGINTNHIGASGVIYGLAAFLFMNGIFRHNLKSIIVAIAVYIGYGGMIYGVLPNQRGISWEGHLFGALAGAFVAYHYRKRDQ